MISNRYNENQTQKDSTQHQDNFFHIPLTKQLSYNRGMKFRQYHLSAVLKSFESHKMPLDAVLSRYFRAHKAIGSKDRQAIAEAAFHYVRFQNLYYHLGKAPSLDPLFPTPNLEPYLRYGVPAPLYQLLVEAYGPSKAEEICQISNTRAPLTIRINPLKTSREILLKKWRCSFNISPCPLSPLGIQFHERINFFTLPEFKEGLFEIQDESSQLAALLVKAKPKEHVLDYCAGAGGKALAFGPSLGNQGQIYLHDIRLPALQEARKRFKRAGIQNVQFQIHPSLKGKMDWIVVDAPCSGTGTLRRNPDLKWKFNLETLHRLTYEQREIFHEAFTYLHPRGTIIYMTCSILPQENEQQIAFFQTEHRLSIASQYQTLPILEGRDGFYAVALKYDL
jgi:16S rRNA C967 or C1407 C5-methylase (RsmB/RsmF family)